LLAGLGIKSESSIRQCLYNEDYLVIMDTEEEVAKLTPDFNTLARVRARGVIVSAMGKQHDFICRFFGPAVGVNEDAVTGSAFTKLVPYWSSKLGKSTLSARQISVRGGNVQCQHEGNRVYLTGAAKTYLRGEIDIPG
jgi:predicted PhzF superfamily epimerase YddE/YHI9